MATHDRRENLWAIVLAAGEGTRLSTLTRSLHDWDMPKQFAALWGDRSFLERTLDRIAAIVPRQRTVVVVADDCKALAEARLRNYHGVKIVVQPSNRGTGAGVLLPLAHAVEPRKGCFARWNPVTKTRSCSLGWSAMPRCWTPTLQPLG